MVYADKPLDRFDSKVPKSGLFWNLYKHNYDESYSLCDSTVTKLLRDATDRMKYEEITDVEKFIEFEESIGKSYEETARGPCKTDYRLKLIKEINHQKELFITKNKIDDLGQQVLQQAYELEQASAQAAHLQQNLLESQKQREIETKHLQDQIEKIILKGEEDKKKLIEHHNETIEIMKKEHKELMDRNMQKLAQDQEMKMKELKQHHDHQINEMNARNEKTLKDQQLLIDQFKNQVQTLNQQVQDSARRAEAAERAAAQASRGRRKRW